MQDVVVERGGQRWIAACSARAVPLAERALNQLAAEVEGPVPDGALLGLMWWPLTVRHDHGVRLLAPEGFGTPPEDLTTVLVLLALQLDAARRVGVDPPGFDPDDVVHVAPGALEAEGVMLQRAPAPVPGSTGWHLRPDGPLTGYGDDYADLPLRELLQRRNSLLVPLALPSGLLVRVHGDAIASVLDGERRERWS